MKKTTLLQKMALAASLLLIATTMSAKDIFVSASGLLTNDGLSEATPVPLSSIVIASNLVQNGDRIVVLGNIILATPVAIDGKSITITGRNAFNDPRDANVVSSISGSTSGRIFNISGSANVVISNLVFENATDKAIAISGDETLIVEIGYCMFRNNSARAVSADGPDNGAAISVVGGAVANIFSCWFNDNQAFRGGALFVDNSTVNVQYSNFNRNFARIRTDGAAREANSAGGAVAAANNYTLTMSYCHFTNNYSHSVGGAFFLYGEGRFMLQNSTVINNYSGHLYREGRDNASDNNGGAFLIYGTNNISIINTTIASNTANGSAWGGGILSRSSSSIELINVTITNNLTTEGNSVHHGGGITIEQGTQLEVLNSIIERNRADADGNWSDVMGEGSGAYAIVARNSVIGAFTWNGSMGNFNITDRSISYDPVSYRDTEGGPLGVDMNESGLGNFSVNCYPLLPSAFAATLGNPVFLFNKDITTDQNDNPRGTGATIFAGAVELTQPTDGTEVGSWVNFPVSDKPEQFWAYGETTNINNIFADGDAVVVGYYNLLGQKLNEEPTSGFYIIRYSNGKSVKVQVR